MSQTPLPPMNILETIIAHKRLEVAQRKQQMPPEMLRNAAGYLRPTYSLRRFLLDPSKTGIIAEFKRRSPSKGAINETADVLQVTQAYTAHGASALSVLTDAMFFGGSAEDLMKARKNNIPILRKDFIVDTYQIDEARAMGADVILLIAACLTPAEVASLAAYAKALDMEVLLELHDESELGHICADTDIIGINNRDLKTFKVDIERSLRMAAMLPEHCIKVAESGIGSVQDVRMFRQFGFHGFLIGENFMKAPDPAIAFAAFVNDLNAQTCE